MATRPRTHLVAVTLRARSRTTPLPARVSRLLNQARATCRTTLAGPDTMSTLMLLLRRRSLGQAAFRVAIVVEAALETTRYPTLETHLDALNAIGVNHHATAQDLAAEAITLNRHLVALAGLATDRPQIAAAMNTEVERDPR